MKKQLILCAVCLMVASASAQAQDALRIDPVAPTLPVRSVSITDMPLPPASDGGKAFKSSFSASEKTVRRAEAKISKVKGKKKTLAAQKVNNAAHAKYKNALKKSVANVKIAAVKKGKPKTMKTESP